MNLNPIKKNEKNIFQTQLKNIYISSNLLLIICKMIYER